MKNKILLFSLMTLIVGLIGKINAVETKISGVIFAHYEYVLSEYLQNGTTAYNLNSVDIPRVQLGVDAKFTDTIRGFIQCEANLITRDNTANAVYLKQALLEIKDIYPNAKLMFGLIPTPWRGYEEGIWKHRFVAKILDDIDIGLPATDRGVRLNGKAVNCVEYDVAIMNGEGTKVNEVNKFKDYIGKVAVAPFTAEQLKGLKLNLYCNKGQYADGDKQERDMFIGGISYESKKFNAMATSYSASSKDVKGSGVSIHSVVNLTEKHWVFARYDLRDPDQDKSDDARSRIFLGFGHKIADGIRAAIDYQGVIQEIEGATNKNQSIVFSHLEVKF